MPNARKSPRKLWIGLLILVVEIPIIFLVVRYLVFSPKYEPLSTVEPSDLPSSEPSIPLPIDDVAEYRLESFNQALQRRIFSPGVSESEVIRALGEPLWRKPGFWANSIAWSYEDMVSPEFDLGYMFDSRTKRLRQAEIAVPPATELSTLKIALESLLGQPLSIYISAGLETVYERDREIYNFQVENLEGVVKRNHQDRVYMAIWEVGFHVESDR